MNLLESQNLLLASLKAYGFFSINFGGKYKRFKNHLFNAALSIGLVVAFTMVGTHELDLILQNTTEKNSDLGYLAATVEIFSMIISFAIIKLYLLVKSDVQEKYVEKLRDLEVTVSSYHVKNTKVNWIITDLRKSTLRQEIFLLVFYISMQFGFGYVAATDNIMLYAFDNLLYAVFNCFFIQILIFLKVNMNFARRLQNHINQVLMDLQKLQKALDVDDFIEVHNKIKLFLEALSVAFGFIFLMTLVAVFGSMIPEFYRSILTIAQSNLDIPKNTLIYIVLCFTWAMLGYYQLGVFLFECDKMEGEVIFSLI
jgi:hypothetical protein